LFIVLNKQSPIISNTCITVEQSVISNCVKGGEIRKGMQVVTLQIVWKWCMFAWCSKKFLFVM